MRVFKTMIFAFCCVQDDAFRLLMRDARVSKLLARGVDDANYFHGRLASYHNSSRAALNTRHAVLT